MMLIDDVASEVAAGEPAAQRSGLCDVCRLRPIVEREFCRVCADVVLRARERCARCETDRASHERAFMPVTIVATGRPALLCTPCVADYRAKTAGGVYFPTWWR